MTTTTTPVAARLSRVPDHVVPLRRIPIPLHELAACTFVPRVRWLGFREPVRKVGHVVLLVMSHRQVTCGPDTYLRTSFRGYRAHLSPSGVACWNADNCCFTVETDTDHLRHKQTPQRMAHSWLLSLVARDLLFASERACRHSWPLPGPPMLPPTLVALPQRFQLAPQCTALVEHHARHHDVSWRQAWRELRNTLRPTVLEARFNQQLVDTRLLDALPGDTLEELHHLDPVLGRACLNPARRVNVSGQVGRKACDMLRSQMPLPIASGCTDADLLEAAACPDRRLLASHIAAIQVWRLNPRQVAAGEAFRFTGPGLEADLTPPRPSEAGSLELAGAEVA